MKYRALHNNNFEFYNTTSDLIGIVGPGTGTGMVISATSGVVTIGNGTPVDLQIGAVGTTVSMKLMGGGSLTANGNTLNFGQSGDTINLNVAGVTYNLPSNLLTTSTFNMVSIAESLRANNNLNGGGTITVDASYNVLWSSRFIVISNGYGTNFSTNGYFDINCPTSGTITGVGGAANATATASGIPLASWQALYYILPIGSSNTSIPGNFRIASYTSTLDIPYNWVLICVRNGDDGFVYFDNGDIIGASQSSNNWYVPGFNSVSGVGVAQASSTSTGALRVQGGAGIGGPLYANQLQAVNNTGAAGATIDAKVGNGNWSINFLARTNGGNYNPLVQTDDSLIYWTNNSQGFGNLVLAPWSNTSTGVRITNTGSVFIPSTTVATAPNTGALVVTGGIYSAGQSFINPGGDTQTRATGLTIAGATAGTYTPGADLGDGSRIMSLITTTAGRPVAFALRNTGNSGFWDIIHDPGTTKLYFQYTGSGYYAMSISNTGTVFINSNTNAISTASGALVVQGGAAIGGTLFATTVVAGAGAANQGNGILSSRGEAKFYYTTYADPESGKNRSIKIGDAGMAVLGGIRTDYLTATTTVNVLGNTAATNTLTGALIVAGGVGVGASVYAGNRIGWSSGTNSVAYQFFNYATNSIDVMFG